MRRASVEGIAWTGWYLAMPLVAKAAAVSEDHEGAGKACLNVKRGINGRVGRVYKHACLERWSLMLYAVEDQVRPSELAFCCARCKAQILSAEMVHG